MSMRRLTFATLIVNSLALAACTGGDDETTETTTPPAETGSAETGGSTAMADPSTTGDTPTSTTDTPTSTSLDPSTTSNDPSTTGGESTSAESTGTPGVMINGCDAATADDLTGDPMPVITQEGLAYAPPCIKVAAGATVKFVSSFALHPLRGGEVAGGAKMPDPASPITDTDTGMEASFTFPDPGAYGYYCDIHGLGGMYGAIFVE